MEIKIKFEPPYKNLIFDGVLYENYFFSEHVFTSYGVPVHFGGKCIQLNNGNFGNRGKVIKTSWGKYQYNNDDGLIIIYINFVLDREIRAHVGHRRQQPIYYMERSCLKYVSDLEKMMYDERYPILVNMYEHVNEIGFIDPEISDVLTKVEKTFKILNADGDKHPIGTRYNGVIYNDSGGYDGLIVNCVSKDIQYKVYEMLLSHGVDSKIY